MNPQRPQPTPDLDDLLRSGARSVSGDPAPDLTARILAALPTVERAPAPPVRAVSPVSMARRRWAPLAVAAALLAVAGGAFWWSRGTAEAQPQGLDGTRLVVASRELFGAGSRVRQLPSLATDSLREEAQFLLADATRVAERIVGGLARPLREPLAR